MREHVGKKVDVRHGKLDGRAVLTMWKDGESPIYHLSTGGSAGWMEIFFEEHDADVQVVGEDVFLTIH